MYNNILVIGDGQTARTICQQLLSLETGLVCVKRDACDSAAPGFAELVERREVGPHSEGLEVFERRTVTPVSLRRTRVTLTCDISVN